MATRGIQVQPDRPVMSAQPERAANPVRHKTNEHRRAAVDVCERGLELKIEMADIQAEYDELKPLIEVWCEANGGTYNSALGSYSTRYTPKYEYPQEIEQQRINLKQAEERARLDGSAIVVNTTVSVAATVTKNSRPSSSTSVLRCPGVAARRGNGDHPVVRS
jgi:hypothetical protein